MRPLDIGRMLTQQGPHLFRVAVNYFDRDPRQAVSGPMLDHLEVMPIGLGLLARRRSPPACVFRHLSPGLNHCFPVAPIPISGYRRRGVRIATSLELSHQSHSHFIFLFPDRSSYPQTSVYVDDSPSPEGTSFLFLWMPPFFPL